MHAVGVPYRVPSPQDQNSLRVLQYVEKQLAHFNPARSTSHQCKPCKHPVDLLSENAVWIFCCMSAQSIDNACCTSTTVSAFYLLALLSLSWHASLHKSAYWISYSSDVHSSRCACRRYILIILPQICRPLFGFSSSAVPSFHQIWCFLTEKCSDLFVYFSVIY